MLLTNGQQGPTAAQVMLKAQTCRSIVRAHFTARRASRRERHRNATRGSMAAVGTSALRSPPGRRPGAPAARVVDSADLRACEAGRRAAVEKARMKVRRHAAALTALEADGRHVGLTLSHAIWAPRRCRVPCSPACTASLPPALRGPLPSLRSPPALPGSTGDQPGGAWSRSVVRVADHRRARKMALGNAGHVARLPALPRSCAVHQQRSPMRQAGAGSRPATAPDKEETPCQP